MLTRNFKNLSKSDVALAGGKGASLGEMTQAGISVPPGFVVLSEAFEQFINEQEITADIDAILQKVKHQDTASVERASEEIKAIILGTEMPKDIATEIKSEFKKLGAKFVAVRSSATAEDSSSAAWAGQLDSFLNTTESKLLENVKRCWASLFTPRAIFYRFEKGLDAQKISVAVVVQKMVESEVSGIAFSVHPVTQDRNQLIIEASYGLGEAIVSGQVTPDSYIVEKQPRSIIERMIQAKSRGLYRLPEGENEWKTIAEPKASKQAISDKQVLELSKLILHIEDHYGFPCDIEWAFEKGKFYIVQSRPITTLNSDASTGDAIEDLDWELWIRRQDQPPFFNSLWIKIEGSMMASLIGGGFTKQLCLRYGDDNLWIRSSSDFKNLRADMRRFLNVQSKKSIDALFSKAEAVSGDIPKLVAHVKSLSDDKLFAQFESIIERVMEALLYTTSMPYFVLDTLEKSKDGEMIHAEAIRKGAEALRALSYYREIKTEVLDRISSAFSKKFKLAKNLAPSLTLKEMRIALEQNKLSVDFQELASRESCAYWDLGNDEIIFSKSPELMEKLRNKVIEVPQEAKDGKMVKGVVAFAGKVTGIVRIVNTEAEMGKVQKGDILVAPTTNPTLMPAMMLCAAIVTDEGGIASHAAIISRELKKPCIVGTKYATHIIKDGDVVEVDANQGTVRVLDKKDDRITFEKIYTRDTTYIMQELWAFGCSEGIEKEFGWKNPYLPGIIHYMNQGSIEIWENLKATEWLEEAILQENKKNPKFIDGILKEYQAKLKTVHALWKESPLGINKLTKLIAASQEAMPYFIAYYYSAVNDKTPKAIRAKALAMRNKDEFFAQNDIVLRSSISSLYPQVKNYETAIFLEELKKIPTIKLLKERKDHSLIVQGKNHFVGSLADFEKANSSFRFKKEAVVIKDPNVIIGEIAQKGKVVGRVKILRRRDQVGEVKEGEVIVSPMTTPDFLPAMERAVAFVTDEGGITCHAGIVARELKKPCIIGTKIATEFLKDGDLVEVDANNGIVRKLSGVGGKDDAKAPIINPAEWEYEFQQRNAQPVLMTDFWTRAIVQELPKELHLPDIHIDYLFTNYAKGYVPKRDKADVLKKINEALKKDVYIKYVAETTMKKVRKFDAITQRVARQSKGKKVDRALLSCLWSEVDRGLVELIAWFWIPWYITEDNLLANKVKERLAKHKAKVEKLTDMNNALMTLIFPTKLSLFQEEQTVYAKVLELASHTKNFAKGAVFKKAAQKYLDQFDWTTMYFLLPLEKMTLEELVKRIKGDLAGDALEEYRLRKDAQKKSLALAKDLQKVLRSDASLMKYAAWSREYGWVLSRSIEESLVASATLIDFFKQVAKAIGVPYKQWIWFKSDEVKNILDGKLKAADVDIKSREQAHFVLVRSGNIQFFTGKQAQEFTDFVENNVGKVDMTITTFTGQPTYPGKATGRVLIAKNGQEAQRLKEGEILITPMTTPDFVPMMKIAGAIITNEGGLLSHAAIISRELHKPCIVGTKIATQVLKDGDLVEVDANTGIIRKLK